MEEREPATLPSAARALCVEPLEDRRMMAINLYVDFGDGFANDAWNVTDSAMRSVSGPDSVDHDDNPATPEVGLFGAGYSVISLEQGVRNRNVDLTGDRRVDRADADLLISQVLATMQRTLRTAGRRYHRARGSQYSRRKERLAVHKLE